MSTCLKLGYLNGPSTLYSIHKRASNFKHLEWPALESKLKIYPINLWVLPYLIKINLSICNISLLIPQIFTFYPLLDVFIKSVFGADDADYDWGIFKTATVFHHEALSLCLNILTCSHMVNPPYYVLILPPVHWFCSHRFNQFKYLCIFIILIIWRES